MKTIVSVISVVGIFIYLIWTQIIIFSIAVGIGEFKLYTPMLRLSYVICSVFGICVLLKLILSIKIKK